MSLRHLTKEQFSAGTSIDGTRLDRAGQDIVDRFNSVPPGDLKSRWTMSTFVSGFMPASRSDFDSYLPFLRERNDAADTYPAATDFEADNPTRHKGIGVEGIALFGYNPIGNYMAWEQAWSFPRGGVLDGLDLWLVVDNIKSPFRPFTQNFEYSTSVPPYTILTEPLKDLTLLVTVDSPFAPEDRSATAVVFSRNSFHVDEGALGDLPTQATLAGDDPGPALLGDTLAGVCIHREGLQIPIPEGARVRLSLILPYYGTAIPGWDYSPGDGILKQQYSLSMGVLEEVC